MLVLQVLARVLRLQMSGRVLIRETTARGLMQRAVSLGRAARARGRRKKKKKKKGKSKSDQAHGSASAEWLAAPSAAASGVTVDRTAAPPTGRPLGRVREAAPELPDEGNDWALLEVACLQHALCVARVPKEYGGGGDHLRALSPAVLLRARAG